MRRRLVIAALVLGALAPVLARAQASALAPGAQLLGFVEELEGEAADSATPAGLVAKLRLGFAKTAAGWRPICVIAGMEGDRPECMEVGAANELRWQLVQSGALAGEVTSSGFYDRARPNLMGALNLAGPMPVMSAARSGEYASWMGGEVRRPVVAMRNRQTPGSVGWKSAPVRGEDLAAVVRLFSGPMPTVPECGQAPRPKLAPEHWQVSASYASAIGERFFGVHLDRRLAAECDGMLTIEWSDFWFHAKASGAPALIDLGVAREPALRVRLIELADFDGDGQVEALLWQASPNEDGYVLLQDGFSRVEKAIWSYH